MLSKISNLDFLHEIITVRINYAIRMANSWNYIQDTGALSLNIKEKKKDCPTSLLHGCVFPFYHFFSAVSFYLIISSCFVRLPSLKIKYSEILYLLLSGVYAVRMDFRCFLNMSPVKIDM